MLHIYVGDTMDRVREKVREPLMRYLKDSVVLWRTNERALEHAKPEE